MRKTLCALALVLSLCGSAFAGDAGCPPIAPGGISSSPGGSQSASVQTADGSTDVGALAPTADMTAGDDADCFAAIALNVIDSMLALL